MHECHYDNLSVKDDVLTCHIFRDITMSQKVNYCPICGWCKASCEIMKLQNPNDGI